MSRQSELFGRAAECERLMGLSSDPVRKQSFQELRNLWVALANECASMTPKEVADGIAAIEEIEAAVDPKAPQ
jgi:hypothetical protein